MRVVRDIHEMQGMAETFRLNGKRIAFVPTMGYLHDGHLSLMGEGKRRSDVLVASIFVNPTQFGPQEDLSSYPRDFQRDEAMMRDVGVDVVFYPAERDMYPDGYQTYVSLEKITQGLCGASRPAHFRGVATIVAKLFHIVKPHVALFGDKDFQQRLVIQRMAKDLNFDVEVIGCPIVRESDGLAMSSRNAYLSGQEREDALTIQKALNAADRLYDKGIREAALLIECAQEILSEVSTIRIDYIKVCDRETLEKIRKIQNGAVLAIAAFVGKTRLIDNCVFP